MLSASVTSLSLMVWAWPGNSNRRRAAWLDLQGLIAVLVPARARRHIAGVIVGPSVLRPGPSIRIVRRLRAPLADLERNGRPGWAGVRCGVPVRIAPSRIGLYLGRRLHLLCSCTARQHGRQPDTQPRQRDPSLQPHLSPPVYAPMAGAITLAEIAGGSNSKSEHGGDGQSSDGSPSIVACPRWAYPVRGPAGPVCRDATIPNLCANDLKAICEWTVRQNLDSLLASASFCLFVSVTGSPLQVHGDADTRGIAAYL